jgi:hypothetical protein
VPVDVGRYSFGERPGNSQPGKLRHAPAVDERVVIVDDLFGGNLWCLVHTGASASSGSRRTGDTVTCRGRSSTRPGAVFELCGQYGVGGRVGQQIEDLRVCGDLAVPLEPIQARGLLGAVIQGFA